GVAVALMSAQHLTQFSRNSNGDVEIRHRQHLRLTAFEPFLRLGGVALGTASVATGVEREHLGGACIAAPHLAAERRGAAVEDVLDGTPMRWQHRRAVSRDVVRREATEHVGDLDHDRASEAGHQSIEQTGLVVTSVPKVPIWKVRHFNWLRRTWLCISLISRENQLFSPMRAAARPTVRGQAGSMRVARSRR